MSIMSQVGLVEINRSNVSSTKEGGAQIKGDPTSFFGTGILCFLDLLGFSRAVKSSWGDGLDSPLMRLMRIKQAPIVARGDQVIVGEYSENTASQESYRARVDSLSDSITISVALPQHLTIGDFVLAYASVAMNLRFIWNAAIHEGFVIRGAAEIGDVYWNEREICGPVLIDAYYLEQRVARTARVIVGPQLLKILAHVCQIDRYDWHSFLMKSSDGLIAFSPITILKVASSNVKGTLETLMRLRNECAGRPEQYDKYHELLDVLNNPDKVIVPTPEDMRFCAERLMERSDKR